MNKKDLTKYSLLEIKALNDNEELIIQELQEELKSFKQVGAKIPLQEAQEYKQIIEYDTLQMLDVRPLSKNDQTRAFDCIRQISKFADKLIPSGELQTNGLFTKDTRNITARLRDFKIEKLTMINPYIFNSNLGGDK